MYAENLRVKHQLAKMIGSIIKPVNKTNGFLKSTGTGGRAACIVGYEQMAYMTASGELQYGKMAERSKACDSSLYKLACLRRVSHLRMEAGVRISLLSSFLSLLAVIEEICTVKCFIDSTLHSWAASS